MCHNSLAVVVLAGYHKGIASGKNYFITGGREHLLHMHDHTILNKSPGGF